jgi:hypothetical protein
MFRYLRRFLLTLVAPAVIITTSLGQTNQQQPTHANVLRGEYGRYRANNDLLSYDLYIRIDQ